MSLPSRGAWIEISRVRSRSLTASSLPSRGAWIEISNPARKLSWASRVAPLTGSVDRNLDEAELLQQRDRRSPHGERG